MVTSFWTVFCRNLRFLKPEVSLRTSSLIVYSFTSTLLEKNFSDMKAGEKMLISSPEVISSYISRIPVGTTITPKEMRHALAKEKGADNTCPVTTGIFLRIAIEEVLDVFKVDDAPIPFWRVIDEKHPILKKLGIAPSEITRMRQKEASQN